MNATTHLQPLYTVPNNTYKWNSLTSNVMSLKSCTSIYNQPHILLIFISHYIKARSASYTGRINSQTHEASAVSISYLFLLFLYVSYGSHSRRLKISTENLTPGHLPALCSSSLSCWCSVSACSKGGCLFLRARGTQFVMVPFHMAFVYSPPLKIESLSGNRVTCGVFSP